MPLLARQSILWVLLGVGACQATAVDQAAHRQDLSIRPRIATSIADQRHAIYFPTDDARMDEAEIAALRAFVRGLERSSVIRIRIDGHADLRGTDAYNLDLSLRRAEAVATQLRLAGITDYRLDVAGLGEDDPAAFGTDPESLSLNRRVELVAETVAVELDGCEDADTDLSRNPYNLPGSRHGCANLANLMNMVADKSDLLPTSKGGAGEALGTPDPVGQFGAVDRYRKRENGELPENGGT